MFQCVLRRLPVLCPSRAIQASGLAGGYDCYLENLYDALFFKLNGESQPQIRFNSVNNGKNNTILILQLFSQNHVYHFSHLFNPSE